MSDATANKLTLLNASVSMPRVGVWTADLTLPGSHEQELTGSVLIDVDGWRWLGTAYRTRAFAEQTEVVVVGGRGKLWTVLPPRFYAGCSASLPITDILTEAGEILSDSSDATALASHLARWTRAGGTAGEALSALAEHIGASWRVLADGTVWVGFESWPLAQPTEKLDEDGGEAEETYAEAPELRPGTSIGGRRVSHVDLVLTPQGLRTRVLFEAPTDTWSRLRGALEAIVRRLVAPTKFLGQYAGRVVKIDSAGRLEIKLDDDRMPGVTAVQVQHGIPGVATLEGVAGRRVLVGFRDGNPEKPYAAGWDAGGTAKLGSLLVVQNASSMALLPPQWFPAGSAGNAAAAAAQAAALLSGNVAYLIPITVSLVEVQ